MLSVVMDKFTGTHLKHNEDSLVNDGVRVRMCNLMTVLQCKTSWLCFN